MVEIWFSIFWGMVATYVVLDGRNLGAAALRLAVSSNAAERRQVMDAIGPLWTWHEVWLIAAGGVLLLAFPAVLSTAFSGYYLALFLVLWLLILRGISIEVRDHDLNPLWQSFWDVVLTASSGLLAVLLGLAFGNILRGVPLDASGEFHLALFTDFSVHGRVGLIDWYTLSVGALSLALLLAHGANYLVLETTGTVHSRSRTAAVRLWRITLALAIVVLLQTRVVRPDLWSELGSRPLAWAFLILAIAGGAAIVSGLKSGLDRRAYAGSCAVIAGGLGARAAASFPVMLHSTLDPEQSISAYQAAAQHESLGIALWWWVPAVLLAALWAVLVGQYLRERASADPEARES
jgi:cytochrome d ubiquinol oxidase subunit II